jgi:uncharacterized protein YbcI
VQSGQNSDWIYAPPRLQVRTHLVQTARPALEDMISGITGAKVVSLHHDISTPPGEEAVLFTLTTAPLCRETIGK